MSVEVCIFGSGPAGCAMAIELARLRRKVVVVTCDDPRPRTFGECLPPAAKTLLDRLQLPTLSPEDHLPCYANESAWGTDRLASTDFISGPYGNGWHLDRPRFDRSLREAASARGVVFTTRASEARWIADCTGRGSSIACKKGARLRGIDRQVAFAAMAHLQRGEDHDSATVTESVPDGWWYTARLTQGRRVVAFQTDGDLPVCRRARHRAGFLELLAETRQIGERLSPYAIEEGFPVALPAGGRSLTQAYGENWIAAGDAVQCYDPVRSNNSCGTLVEVQQSA